MTPGKAVENPCAGAPSWGLPGAPRPKRTFHHQEPHQHVPKKQRKINALQSFPQIHNAYYLYPSLILKI
jgi:hypothetical protein